MQPIKRLSQIAVWCVLFMATIGVFAQPLPKVRLISTFPKREFERPVWMSEAPDGSGRLFVIEQQGRILALPKGSDGTESSEFFNITNKHPFMTDEEGLMSIAFHPGFKTNGLFYVYYNQENTNAHFFFPRRSVISEFRVSKDNPNVADLSTERVVLEVQQPFANHKGGEICFGPDGYLYLGFGDGGQFCDPFNNGQNTASFLGKILRIDVNTRGTLGSGKFEEKIPYGIPSDNPYVNEPYWYGLGSKHEIYALGFRNPWRYSFDKQTGELWVGDVGQDYWEEVDHVVKGGNYGWCAREGMHYFKPSAPGSQFLDPVIEYPHRPEMLKDSKFPNHSTGLCIIGGYVYRGQKYPALQGVYLYADYNIGTIWGMRYKDGQVTDYATLLEQPKNIVSFAEDADGEVYVMVFDGHVYTVGVKE
ncbi:MAG TPA: PQQ-dependent sugar dehydrogenase [Verrucomicrobiae bacterium]|jgi:glucose/arabinose dehydrogenase